MLSQPNYRVVLEAVSALRANQREMPAILSGCDGRLDSIEASLTRIQSTLHDTNTRVRSLQETTGEIKELLIRALDR